MSKSLKPGKHFFWLNWSIQTKFTSIIILILVTTLATLLINSGVSLTNKTYQSTAQSFIQLSDETLQRLAGNVSECVAALQTMALSPAIIDQVETGNVEHQNISSEDIAAFDQKWKDGDPGIEDRIVEIENNQVSADLKIFLSEFPEEVEVFVTDLKGLNVAMTDRTSDYWQADEGWWEAAYNKGQGAVYVGEVEFDESTGVYAMNIGVPVYDRRHDRVIGVLRGTVDITAIFDSLRSFTVGETGHALLLDKNGNILYSNSPELFLDPAPEHILTFVNQDSSGWSTSLSNEIGEPALMGYNTTKGDLADLLGWKLVILQAKVEVNQQIVQNQIVGQLIAMGLAMVMVMIGWFLSSIISRQIKQITRTVNILAGGDLQSAFSDQSLEKFSNQKDEVGEMNRACLDLFVYMKEMVGAAENVASGNLAQHISPRSANDVLGNAFQKMIVNLKEALARVAENSQNLGKTSGNLASSAKQAGEASSQIAKSIQDVARGTAIQTESISRTASSVDQLTKAIEAVATGAQEQASAVAKASSVTNQINLALQQVSRSAQTMRSDSENAAMAARDGARIMEETISGMQTIKKKVGLSTQKVEEMGSRSDQIGAIVQTIEDIASQTNLLALNAAIEAARAGEHGKGFAVVADEVRKLAEKASSSTKEISTLIKSIQEMITEAVNSMEEGSSEVENGVLRTNRAGESLDSILKAAEAVNQQARETNLATEQMSLAANELIAAMDSVSAVVEENTVASEQMSANSGEVSQSIENIASVSQENSAAVEEVSASTEEMSNQVQDVTRASHALDLMAQALQEVVNQFRI